jgi:phosphoglycerol transferase MdoB-like AlkP superfamily enzyme
MLLIFIISLIIPNAILKITSDMRLLNIKSIALNLNWIFLFVAISFRYKSTKAKLYYYFVISFLTFLLTYGNILYYRHYQNFLSLSLMKQVRLFADVSDVALAQVNVFDFVYWFVFACLLILFLIHFRKDKSKLYSDKVSREYRNSYLKMALLTTIIGLVSLSPKNFTQFFNLWNRPTVVENFGIYNYHIADSIRSISIFFEPETNDYDYQKFLDFFKEKNKDNEQNKYSGIFKDKNVIVIHAESVEQFLINSRFNGQDITPNFSALANEGFYFSNFYSQESIGTSSDTEFVFDTSLLPVNNGTIFLTHFNNKYNSTPQLLREEGYYTSVMHGNDGTYWNRNLVYPHLGYDYFYEKNNTYQPTEEQIIGLGINDLDFFNKSVDIIDSFETKFYTKMITLTNHVPFDKFDKYVTIDEYGNETSFDCGEDIEYPDLCGYLKSVHYADWAFGEFKKELEARGILDDTIIVLYGDHPAKLDKEEMEFFYGVEEMTNVEYKAKQKVPFIIWSNDIEEPVVVDQAMGMMDAGPTLQNMLGIYNEFALGRDIFSIEENFVPFVNGDWTDGKVYYDLYRNEYYIYDEELMYDEFLRYVEENIDEKVDFEFDQFITYYIEELNLEAEKIVTISNLINRNNLLKYHEIQKSKISFYFGYGG